MNRHLIGFAASLALLAGGLATASAAAATSGHETFNGAIVTSGASGQRVVVSSVVVARGVFNGVGRIVEVDNLPGDSDDISRDDIVFAAGTLHLVSLTRGASFSLDPRTCLFRVDVQQTGSITGGTGRFAGASGASVATVIARGLAARAADRSCSPEGAPLAELDTLSSSGTLAF